MTLVLLIPQLSAGGTCSSQDVADSVDQRIRGTLANFTKNYAQIDELLAPVSTFLQATLIKQVLAEYGINPTNTTCKSNEILERQLNQIREAILRVESNYGQSIAQINKTLKQILQKLNMSTDSNGYPPSSLLHSCEEIKTQYPNSLSDYYMIINGSEHTRHVIKLAVHGVQRPTVDHVTSQHESVCKFVIINLYIYIWRPKPQENPTLIKFWVTDWKF